MSDAEDGAFPKDKAAMAKKIRDDFALDFEVVREDHEEAYADLRFRAGDQWDDSVKKEREDAKRPCPVVDHISERVRQVTGDIRLNKPSVKVRPVDDESDPEVAELFSGLIRNIEQQSDAPGVYVNAGDNAATCGQAAFRITTDYTNDMSFDQDIIIQGIENPLAVVWDRDSKHPVKEDAKRCFVLETYSKEAFKLAWPDADLTEFDADGDSAWTTDWCKDDMYQVSEAWYKRPVKKKLARLPDGRVIMWTDTPDDERATYEMLASELDLEIEFRDVDGYEVTRYITNGAEILEEPEVWAGRYIPIIPVFGETIHVGDKVVRRGMVRTARWPQQMINYSNAAAIETIALSPKSPFIATAMQIEDNPDDWDNANNENLSVLTYKPDGAAPPPQRQPPAQIPAAMLSLKQEGVNDLNSAMGIYPSSLGGSSGETSGKAILARERQGDVGTFVYIDNLSKSIAYAGKQLLDLIPRVYDGQRVVRLLGEDETEELVEINAVDPVTNEITMDLSRGRYDVVVNTGPSFSTKRQEAAESVLQFMQTMPQEAAVVMDLLVKNLDWPGADDIAERFRKRAIAQGIVEPDPEKDEAAPEPEGPSPEDMEKMAKTKKTEAEAQGVTLDNTQKQIELMLASGAVQEEVKKQVLDIMVGLGFALPDIQGQAPQGTPAIPLEAGPFQQ